LAATQVDVTVIVGVSHAAAANDQLREKVTRAQRGVSLSDQWFSWSRVASRLVPAFGGARRRRCRRRYWLSVPTSAVPLLSGGQVNGISKHACRALEPRCLFPMRREALGSARLCGVSVSPLVD
jgi:hypothetical protein